MIEEIDLNNKEPNQPVDYYHYTLYLPTGEYYISKMVVVQQD